MPHLEIRDLSKSYEDVRALKDVSLNIYSGLFGLLGPNGAGKSTLMRTVATLQAPDGGTLRFDGVDVLAEPGYVRRRLGYLPQEFGVYPHVSARRLLDHLAVLKGVAPAAERRRQIEGLLALTNLEPHADRAVAEYSGGMRQRFGITQALLGDPALVVVDEPTAGLDPAERNRFHDLLSRIGEDRIVILSTHIVDDVRTLCSGMAVLSGGRVVLQGSPAALLDRVAGRVWKKTVDRDEVDAYRGSVDLISRRLVAGRVQLRAWAHDRPGEGFEPATADLEDLYFTALRGHEADAPRMH